MQSDFTGDTSNGTVSVMARKVSGPEGIGNIAFGFELGGGQPINPEITLDDGAGKPAEQVLMDIRRERRAD